MNLLDSIAAANKKTTNDVLEPTPLSDAIQLKHLLYRKQRIGLLLLQQQQWLRHHNSKYICQSSTPSAIEKRQKERKNGKVRFRSHVLVHFSVHDLDDLKHCWYTKSEMSEFKMERKRLVKALQNCNFDLNKIDQSVYTLRGLEPFFSLKFNNMIHQKRMRVIKSVLAEQSRQKKGTVDPESIRKISYAETEWARQRGVQLGKEDAEVAVFQHSFQRPIEAPNLRPQYNHRAIPRVRNLRPSF
jgi:hypothetical protein